MEMVEGLSEVMEEMETVPGGTEGETEAVTVSPRLSTAQPRKSKPGPRLAIVAGAKDLTDRKRGEGDLVGWEEQAIAEKWGKERFL